MRKTILAMWLAAVAMPAMARAQSDGGMPDGMANAAPRGVDDQGNGGHTGSSNDPNGNMGNAGRTGKPEDPDGGTNGENNGAEGNTGAAPDTSHQPEPERRWKTEPTPKSPVTP